MSDQPQEKKIIIDEDWKSQVEAEKQAARKTKESDPEAPSDTIEDVPLPPPTLEILIASLATQAMVSLGLLPNPVSGEQQAMPQQAKHLIDMIAMLQEKTAGNRTEQESALLDDTLHQLRMAFVSVSQNRPTPSN